MQFQAPRGTEDVLPGESHKWQWLESRFREISRLYGYEEIRTPTFEDTELFVRTSGDTSEIVTKQMYSFFDKGDRNITLKPEGTAPVMRSLIEHSLCPPGTVRRLYYITPFFRYERPQKGRLREAHQCGLELVGSSSAVADAEIIEITVAFFRSLGLTDLKVLLNSIGRNECRATYREEILAHVAEYLASLDEEAQSKVRKNPLRLLDSKDPAVQERLRSLRPIQDFLEPDSRQRFEEVQRLLAAAGVPFEVAPNIVRGLDYYTETVFEVHSTRLGSQSAFCGGGRYDDLIKDLGGSPTPAVGVGIGIERALIVLEAEGVEIPVPTPDVFIVAAGESARGHALELARELRAAGAAASLDVEFRSMKAQFRVADKSGARYAAVLGDDEAAGGYVTLRELSTGEQRQVGRDRIVSEISGLRS